MPSRDYTEVIPEATAALEELEKRIGALPVSNRYHFIRSFLLEKDAARGVSLNDLLEHTPALIQKVLRASYDGFSKEPVISCKHVVEGAPLAFLCVPHPAAGLMCQRCYERHVARHAPDVERCCDQCGRDAFEEGINPIGWPPAKLPITVRDTRGYRRELIGYVQLMTLGICKTCAAVIEEAKDSREHDDRSSEGVSEHV